METEWDWRKSATGKLKQKIKLKKEGNEYELWRIWWTICATKLKRKIK